MSDDKDNAIPFFMTRATEDPSETKKNGGVPVYKDVPYVEIRIPGSREVVCRPVEDRDKDRWPRQWEQFEKGQKQELEGVPISEWANATESERLMVRQLGLMTVEQVAGVSDANAQKSRILRLKQKAEKFLQSRKGTAEIGKIQVENEDLKKLVAKLEKQVAQLEAKLDAADDTVPKRNEGKRVHAAN